MKILQNDRNILKLVRLEAILPIILFSIIITFFYIQERSNELNDELKNLKEQYISINKENVENEVNKVFDFINEEIQNSHYNLKELLKNKVYEAHAVATNIYNNEISTQSEFHKFSKEQALITIKNALGGMIYNKGRGYIFIDDAKGTKILQPLNKELEGKNFFDYQDKNGYKLFNKISQTIIDKSENFDEYYWYKSKNDKKSYKKISFYKYFEPLDLAIGTGEYYDDYENELKNKILEKINKIKYGKNGYIFAFDRNGTYLSHHIKDYLGKNGFETQDINKNYFIKDIITYIVEKKEGFFSYNSATKPSKDLKSTDKISYAKYLEPWGWVIGTGFYLDELKKQIEDKEKFLKKKYKETINNIILASIIITILMLLISTFTANIISNRFDSYKNSLEEETKKTIEKEKMLIQQSKMAMMGEMISSIAHQWKQPLSMISTAISGIKMNKEFGVLTDEVFNEGSKAIQDSVKYMAHTIDDFRDFFNPNKIKVSFSIQKTIEKTLNLISNQFRNNNIEIIKEINDFEILGFENELLQVLINLFKNSKDEFIKSNRALKLIFVKTYIENNNCCIVVYDNAGGIPDNIIDKIYEPYFTTKENDNGTGIGLYMSKEIIKGMNGSILVENYSYIYKEQQQKGAKFTIKIPITNEKEN